MQDTQRHGRPDLDNDDTVQAVFHGHTVEAVGDPVEAGLCRGTQGFELQVPLCDDTENPAR